MKYFIIFSLIICFSSAASAENYFQDVPEGHWAAGAVYELVKMGVTKGYPDGTFRGKRQISRYEIAAFLSKLARSFNRRQGIDEKLIEELKTEIALIKYKREKAAKETQFSGVIESHGRTSPSTPRGGRADYRLKLNLLKNFDEKTSLKIGLDTVDAGFNTDSDRNLATKLIDIESRFKLAGFNFKVNLGPGVVPHMDDFFPSENNTIYIRPKTAVKASTKIGKMDFSASYVTRQVETSGRVGVHELTSKLKYKFGDLAVHFRPRYLFKLDGPADTLAEVGMNFILEKNWITYLLLSAGDFQAGRSGMYLKVIEKINDPWKTGTNIVVRFDKVGSKYRRDDLNEYEFVYLNNFDRLILDGTMDVGLKIRQKLFDGYSLEWKGDYVTTGGYKYGEEYPETYFLWQIDFSYKFSSKIGINAYYRSYNVPSGIAQFSDAVPKISEIIGIGLKCQF
ncbi:MAG: S-layer homology domain-containing protein [Candidatus Margulisiibacteriota bacterium]